MTTTNSCTTTATSRKPLWTGQNMSRHANGCVNGLLEPCAVKAARTVLRGEGSRKAHPPTRDWSRFDIVGVDLYRDAGNWDSYREQLRAYATHERPLVVTEFGCCTYRGAPDRGAMGWAIVDRTVRPPRLTEEVVRDEQVQATYLTDVLDIL